MELTENTLPFATAERTILDKLLELLPAKSSLVRSPLFPCSPGSKPVTPPNLACPELGISLTVHTPVLAQLRRLVSAEPIFQKTGIAFSSTSFLSAKEPSRASP